MRQGLKKITIFFLSLLFLNHTGCDKTKQEYPNKIIELNFNVNPKLISSKIIDSTNYFEFSPPVSLTEMSKDSITISNALFKEIITDSMKVSMLYAFQDSSKKNYLFVTQIIFPNDSVFSLLDKYEDVLFKKAPFVGVEKTRYLKDGLLISQFLFTKAENVFIKIFFESKHKSLIQFDYIFSLKDYKDRVRSIESSIGSIVIL